MKLMVYSHDSFGLGNIRRMVAICKYLLETLPEVSILLVSGSPMLHSFRLPPGLDYIKLPCMGRDLSGKVAVKYLSTNVEDMIRLRSHSIAATAANYQPDLFLIDKKPYGLCGELKETLALLKVTLPQTKFVLLLRDILDDAETTISEWKQYGFYEAIEEFYDRVLVVGMPEIFDVVREYQFSETIAQKVRYCGYIRREPGRLRRQPMRDKLKIAPDEKLVLVTPGGGGDGYRMVESYLWGLTNLEGDRNFSSRIILGSEMPDSQKEVLFSLAEGINNVELCEFSDDVGSEMEAADLVVCMGGYNTVCEVLSYNKRAIVVPRIHPVREQWIRAERMAEFGLFQTIHPHVLTPEHLMESVLAQLEENIPHLPPVTHLDLNALPCIEREISQLLFAGFTGDTFFKSLRDSQFCAIPKVAAKPQEILD